MKEIDIPKPVAIGIAVVVALIAGYVIYANVFAGPTYTKADQKLNEQKVDISDSNFERNQASQGVGGAQAAPTGEEAARMKNPR